MSTSVTASPAKSTAPRLRTPRKKHTPGKPKRNVLLTVLMALMVLYTVVPLIWLIINSTKTQSGIGPRPDGNALSCSTSSSASAVLARTRAAR